MTDGEQQTKASDRDGSSQRLVSVRDLQPNDEILRADGKFCGIQGAYPAGGTIFVQFKDGMGWDAPEDGRVFIKAR